MRFVPENSYRRRICLSLSGKTFKECQRQLGDAPFAELRLDRIEMNKKEIADLIESGYEWIIAVREPFLQKTDYADLFSAALIGNIRFVDFDFDIIQDPRVQKLLNIARKAGFKIMYSWHDFEKTPDREFLMKKRNEISEAGPDAIKMVCMGNNLEDAGVILYTYRNFKNITAFCLGEECCETRITAMKWGLGISYAHPDGAESTAPGQFSYSDMLAFGEILDRKGEFNE
ncbi:3-dehydroquinate dehydratase [anaerobic digester metagenome]